MLCNYELDNEFFSIKVSTNPHRFFSEKRRKLVADVEGKNVKNSLLMGNLTDYSPLLIKI